MIDRVKQGHDTVAKPKTRRLFFALWPDAELRREIADLSRAPLTKISGRFITVDNLHLTLVFLGSVNGIKQQCMERMAAGIQCRSFTLILDRIGTWPKSGILWLGATRIPPPLQNLAQTLQQELQHCGYEPERRPFHAHVTLARKVRKTPPVREVAPLAWEVSRFHLIESTTLQTGAKYHVLDSWELG